MHNGNCFQISLLSAKLTRSLEWFHGKLRRERDMQMQHSVLQCHKTEQHSSGSDQSEPSIIHNSEKSNSDRYNCYLYFVLAEVTGLCLTCQLLNGLCLDTLSKYLAPSQVVLRLRLVHHSNNSYNNCPILNKL